MTQELLSMADAPGTSREYETIYILRPTITNDEVGEVNIRIRSIIEGMNGKILKVDNWGKRRLAYEVKKERKGIYLYWQYLAGPGVVDEFERNLRMLDSVIRYMTVKLDANIDPNARPSEVTDETYEKAANTAADEEDMFLRHPHDESSEDGLGDDDDDMDDDLDDIVPGDDEEEVVDGAAPPVPGADDEDDEDEE